MLLGGDEIGRTQQGNNNAYCQDNALSWYDWDEIDDDLLAFTQRLIRFRLDHPCSTAAAGSRAERFTIVAKGISAGSPQTVKR